MTKYNKYILQKINNITSPEVDNSNTVNVKKFKNTLKAEFMHETNICNAIHIAETIWYIFNQKNV